MRQAARRDANEQLIVDALEQVGALVCRVSGKDVPDLIVGWRGRYLLLEVKQKGSNLKQGQLKFHGDHLLRGLPCYVVRDVAEALETLGVIV